MNTLLLPGSLWPLDAGVEPYSGLPSNALIDALAGAAVETVDWVCWSTALTQALTGSATDAPFAAVAAQAASLHPVGSPGTWMRCDPAHFEVGREDVALATPHDFTIDDDEARALAATLNAHFVDDGIELHVLSPQQWVAHFPQALKVRTVDPWAALHVPARYVPTQGADARALRQFATQAQMLLHDHSVNAVRETKQQASVNALWPWASGTVSFAASVPTAQMLITSCKQAYALARALQVPTALAPDGQPTPALPSGSIGYFPDAMRAFLQGNGEGWRALFAQRLATAFGAFAAGPVSVVLGGQRPTHRVLLRPVRKGMLRRVTHWFAGVNDPARVLFEIAKHGA